MRGKFKCLIDIGNSKGKKYVRGTWNIIIVNVNLNTVSISNPDYSTGQIRTAFEKRTINLNEIKYVKLADIAYIPLRSEWVAYKQPIAIKSKRGT